MSRHEGVSCDSCSKANFRGKRYKCLICYDYDLCATCYEAGATTTRHTTDHPMQCILTRTDFELYYGGETLTAEQPQSFTCPYCSKMGFTEQSLQEHVTSDPSDHTDASMEVVCPICASLPGGDPNHVTDDFAAHLTIEHRAPRDFQDEPLGSIRHHVRRIPHPSRGMGGTRARRNMPFQSAASNLPGLSPSARDVTMDPIAGRIPQHAQLLSQLSSVRNRAAAAQSVSSQLQQLEMQLQSTRQQLERLPRRQAEAAAVAKATTVPSQPTSILDFSSAPSNVNNANSNSQFLLARLGEPELNEFERQIQETDRADRSQFVQELALSTLAECLRLVEDDESSKQDGSNNLSSQSSPADSTDNNLRESSPSNNAGQVNGSGGSAGAAAGGGGGSGGSSGSGSAGGARSSPPLNQQSQQQQQPNSNNSSLHSLASGVSSNVSNGPTSSSNPQQLQGGGLAGGGGGLGGGGIGGQGGGPNNPPPNNQRPPRVAPHVSAATAASHRNKVKQKEAANVASRNSGKEPPPLARH